MYYDKILESNPSSLRVLLGRYLNHGFYPLVNCVVKVLSKYSARRVLDEYSKAYQVKSHDIELEFEVPKQLRDLDKKLGFNLFPKMQS
jgi:hypothetical protein